jgi:hypothetical protein
MRLIPDIELAESLSEVSLSTDMEAVKIGKKRNATDREVDNDLLFNNTAEVK